MIRKRVLRWKQRVEESPPVLFFYVARMGCYVMYHLAVDRFRRTVVDISTK